MPDKLDTIRAFAAKAHDGQQRKYTPDPYMIHPEAVMETCTPCADDACMQYAALLHDVLEDTTVTLEKMEAFLGSVLEPAEAERTLGLVVELTDVYTNARFPEWNRRKRKRKEAERLGRASAAAQTIKYADIINNCKGIAQDDPEFGPKYLYECGLLLDAMQDGNPALYLQARTAIRQELAAVNKDKQQIAGDQRSR